MEYFNLSKNQIQQLEKQGCVAEDWQKVFITEATDLSRIDSVHFSGTNYIKSLSGNTMSYGGVCRKNGIYNAHLHNCTIGNSPFIRNVENYIANYTIGDNVVVENVQLIAIDGVSAFGNGVVVEPMNEIGGRSFPMFNGLSAQMAYVLAIYRDRIDVIQKLEEIIEKYVVSVKSSCGTIANNAKICNVGTIKAVNIGEYAYLSGATHLENGSINSCEEAPIYIGTEVMARDFIVESDTIIDNATLLSKCFVGQGCILDRHYSAENSVFFANSQGFNGEACSLFAGPYTVTHHKSTLLIAGMFSFMNAGSGSNQSNHMYKLGPIHQGILERGAKTTSNSYMLWPSKVGAFTLVMGRHYHNTDSSDLPFSYLIENNDESVLAPGVNLRSVGTVRDAQKWPKRDRRHPKHRTDCINFNLLSPFTIRKMYNGKRILEQLEEISGHNAVEYTYQGMKIRQNALQRGKKLYDMGIYKFLGNSIISRIHNKNIQSTEDLRKVLQPNDTLGKGKWVDVAGLICPLEALERILCDIEEGKITNLQLLQQQFVSLHSNYYDIEWVWSADLLEKYVGIPISKFTPKDFIKVVERWKECVVALDRMLYNDAKKEFSLSTQVGFGADGDKEVKEKDFRSVRGAFETHTSVKEILEHIRRKTQLGNRVIVEMQDIIDRESERK